MLCCVVSTHDTIINLFLLWFMQKVVVFFSSEGAAVFSASVSPSSGGTGNLSEMLFLKVVMKKLMFWMSVCLFPLPRCFYLQLGKVVIFCEKRNSVFLNRCPSTGVWLFFCFLGELLFLGSESFSNLFMLHKVEKSCFYQTWLCVWRRSLRRSLVSDGLHFQAM